MAVEVEGANRHDRKLTRSTRVGIVVDRPEPTEVKPQGMCLDKGYDYQEVRDILHDFRLNRPYSISWGRGQGHQKRSQVEECAAGSWNAYIPG